MKSPIEMLREIQGGDNRYKGVHGMARSKIARQLGVVGSTVDAWMSGRNPIKGPVRIAIRELWKRVMRERG